MKYSKQVSVSQFFSGIVLKMLKSLLRNSLHQTLVSKILLGYEESLWPRKLEISNASQILTHEPQILVLSQSSNYYLLYIKLFFFHVGRLTIGREKEREAVRQCFLFSNHLIITSRTQGGKLHLVDIVGKIPLADITLLEDPNEEERTDDQGTFII